jgi:uncharacterized protein YceH (UPF0502 family)
LLCGEVEDSLVEGARQPPRASGGGDGERIARLEGEVAALRSEVAELKLQLAAFRKEFE